MRSRRRGTLRLAFSAFAVVAVVAMHGSGAEAHACHSGSGAGERSAGHEDHQDHHGPPDPTDGSTTAPCGAVACTAVVLTAPEPMPVAPTDQGPLRPVRVRPLIGTTAPPDPPVPRALVHA